MNLWNIDIFTFYGGYGLLGPKEACGFIASERAAEMLGGSSMREKYEMASLNMPAIAGLHRALEFVIQKKVRFLCNNGLQMVEYFIRKIQHVSGVHIIGPGYKDRIPVISIQTDFMPVSYTHLGLDQIEETEDAFIIGCMTSLRTIECHEGLNRYFHGMMGCLLYTSYLEKANKE